MRLDYKNLNELAVALDCNVADLLVLSSENDPFYAGRGSRDASAKWFADLWEKFDWQAGMHLRRAHYVLISQSPPILKPDGRPYENTENDWSFLGVASLGARYLRLLPTAALIDRRNPAPVLNADRSNPVDPNFAIKDGNLSFQIFLPTELELPDLETSDFDTRQDYIVELWVEKSTQNDVLVPLAERLGVNLIVGVGETSETFAREAVERAISDSRPMRILYVSDFDPGGRSMPVALSRKIEFWVHELEADLDIVVHHVLLTPDQCETFQLPRIPLKESERRAAKFEERFGQGATELDALEALYPGQIAKIVEAEIKRYIDVGLEDRMAMFEKHYQDAADEVRETVLDRHNITKLETEYALLRQSVAEFRFRAQQIWNDVAFDLREHAPDIEVSEIPSPVPANPPSDPLFDSTRDYVTQLGYYHSWQGRTVGPKKKRGRKPKAEESA